MDGSGDTTFEDELPLDFEQPDNGLDFDHIPVHPSASNSAIPTETDPLLDFDSNPVTLTLWVDHDREGTPEENDVPRDEAWYNARSVQPVDLLQQSLKNLEPWSNIDEIFARLNDTGYASIYEYHRMNKYQRSVHNRDPYNDEEAEMKYMASKPTCFIILGMPLNGSRNLAKRIADYWGCIVIDAESVLQEELKNDPDGIWATWIKLSLSKGDKIESDRIFQLIQEKMHSPAARHVGYVMVGVPIIPTTDFPIEEDHDSQLNDVLQSDMYPDIIIHVTCDENDVYHTRERLKCDTTTGIEIDYHILQQYRIPGRFSVHDDKRQEPYIDDWGEFEKEKIKIVDASAMDSCFITLNYNQQPDLSNILMYYRININPVIEYAIKTHDKRFVIKLDGTTPSFRMMEVFKAKLHTLPLVRAYPVIWMSKQKANEGPSSPAEGEGAEVAGSFTENTSVLGEDNTNFTTDDLDQAFSSLRESQAPGFRFRWRWSTWGKRCPVTSTKFSDVQGKAEFACRFMDKIYFMANEEACETFINNPRPYLTVVEEHLPDRIFIAGPQVSGKTTLANRLAEILDAKVFDMDAIEAKILDDRPVKRATTSLAVMYDDTLSLAQKEAVLTFLMNTYSFHKSLVLFIKYHTNMWNMESVVRGVNRIREIPARELVFKEEWYHQHMAKEPVPVLKTHCVTLKPYKIMLENFKHATNNSVANTYDLPDYDRASALAERLREYEGEGMVDQTGKLVPSTKTWIVDNPPLRCSFWKWLEMEGTLPNRVIFLFDETGDYDYVLRKFEEGELYHYLNYKRRAEIEQAVESIALHEARVKEALETREAEIAALQEAQRIEERLQAEEAARAAKEQDGELFEERVASSLTYGLGSPFPVTESEELLKQEMSSKQEISYEKVEDFDRISTIEEEIRTISLSSPDLILTNRFLRSASAFLHSLDLPLQGEYKARVARLNAEWPDLKQLLVGKARADTVKINDMTLSAFLGIAELHTNVALVPQARQKTALEKAMEKKIELLSMGDVMHAEDLDDSDQNANFRELYDKTTNLATFGDTLKYCPVTFRKRGLLCVGKEEFTCVYLDKTYFLRNREAEEEFIANPTAYVGHTEPIDYKLFAPRICIVGPIGSGKTVLAQWIARKINANYFNFDEMMENKYMKGFEKKIGRKYEEEKVREVLGLSANDFDGSDGSETSEIINDVEEEESVKGAEPNKDLGDIFVDSNVMKEALRDYLVLGKGIPFAVLDAVVAETWFSDLFSTEGIVMDGFPNRPSDIEYMEKRCIVPDLIVHLEIDNLEAATRRYREFMLSWKEQQARHARQRSLQLMTRIIDSISELGGEFGDEREEEQNSNDKVEGDEEEEEDGEETKASENSSQFKQETAYQAMARISENIHFWVGEDKNFCRTLEAYAQAENIPWSSYPGNLDLQRLSDRALYQISLKNCLEKIHRLRNFSVVRYVSREEAHALIKSGFFMLSKFAYWCPVQVFEHENIFPAFRPSPDNDILPVIYRKFIYFIASPRNLHLFEMNPEKYLKKNAYMPLVHLGIAVQGPPYSGKTELSKRLAREYNLRVVSAGDALRYILTNMEWSDLGKRIKKHLQDGLQIDPFLLVEAVLAFIKDEKGITGGFVFDGFPRTIEEAQVMELNGLTPMVILNITASFDDLLESIRNTTMHTNYLGTERFFSIEHMECKIINWFETIPEVVQWQRARYANVHDVEGPISRWFEFEETKEFVDLRLMNIFSYETIFRDKPHSLSCMCITPDEFDRRKGYTAHFCIVCWAITYQLVTEGNPPPAHGLIQYKDKYYFVCQAHQRDFLINPDHYMYTETSFKASRCPSPVTVGAEDKLYANGLCIITYVNNYKPCRVRGLESLAVKYGEYVYLFADKQCQIQFMENPELYCGRKIRYQETLQVDIDIPAILSLGYLEQSVARIVNAAVACFVEFRPSFGRVNMSLYASVYVGLQLISHNPDAEPEMREWALQQIMQYHQNSQFVNKVFSDCRVQLIKTTEEFLND